MQTAPAPSSRGSVQPLGNTKPLALTSGSDTGQYLWRTALLRRRGVTRATKLYRGRRKRFSRQKLRAIGGVVNDRRDDRSRLHQICRLHVIECVHLRVVRQRVVFERVLNKLKS